MVGIVTDWGANMRAAERELGKLLPNCVILVSCFMHLLNNALKDFAKEPHLEKLIADVKELVEFMCRHTATHALYDAKKKELQGTALVKPVATRFGSNISMLHSIVRNE